MSGLRAFISWRIDFASMANETIRACRRLGLSANRSGEGKSVYCSVTHFSSALSASLDGP